MHVSLIWNPANISSRIPKPYEYLGYLLAVHAGINIARCSRSRKE